MKFLKGEKYECEIAQYQLSEIVEILKFSKVRN